MSKAYKVTWTECVGHYTYINATSKEEALKKFHNGEIDSCEPDGFCEMQTDSESAIETCPECNADWEGPKARYTIGCPTCLDHEHGDD